MGLKEGRVAPLRNCQGGRFLGALFVEILFKPLTKAAGVRTHDTVDRRVIVASSFKERLSDTLLVNIVRPPSKRQLTEVHQQAAEPRRTYKRRRRYDALHQLPTWVTSNYWLGVDLKSVLRHEAQSQVHTQPMNIL